MLKSKKIKSAFTLLEMVVVIAILALLLFIAIPKYNNMRKKAATVAHNTNVKTLESAVSAYISIEGIPKTQIEWTKDNDKAKEYIKQWPKIPSGLGLTDESYKIIISVDGKITVIPGVIEE